MRDLTILAVLLALPISSHAGDKARKPNIIILLADDLGYADLSMHGSKEITTPHIDSLAKNGTRFTNGYVSAPYCSPTRAGLLTGRYQQRFGHEFNPVLKSQGGREGLPTDQRTMADLLRALGYRTALVGKWHLGEEDVHHPQARGFDEYFGFLPGAHSYTVGNDEKYGPIYRGKKKAELPANAYLTDVFAQEATAFIERNKANPFFLYLAFNAVHTPMEAPEKTRAEFAGVKDEKRRTYLAMTRKLDDAVGAVLAKLRELHLEEDTIIFFLSDNGGPTTKFAPNGSRNFPLRGSKGDTWEGGIRVPFVIQWKGQLPADKTDNRAIISLDILPTALAAAQMTRKAAGERYQADSATQKKTGEIDGINLLPFIKGDKAGTPHEALYWRFGSQMAIRKGDWVLVRPSMGTKEYENIATTALLFDLAKDIGQQKDVAAQNPDRVRAMQAEWDRWNATLMAPRWPATFQGKPFKMP